MASDDGGCDVRCSGEVVHLSVMPEGCIASVLSLTTPKDTCRLSLVSKMFKSAADSDAVWESFLPSGYDTMIPVSLLGRSKKEVYLSLCDNPVLIDDGKKSFSLEKESGKKCYMLSPRSLTIIWGSSPEYWQWISRPESRFAEVAELRNVCWLEIRGKIKTRLLSPETMYAIHLVFQLRRNHHGFDIGPPILAGVGIAGGEFAERSVDLDPEREYGDEYYAAYDRDCEQIMEVELGEYYNRGDEEEDDDDGELEIYVRETMGGHWKGGVVFHGIDIKPR